jgi:Zn-dependent protease
MRGSIPLGSVLGIRLRVHITFVILLCWVAVEAGRAGGLATGLWTAALLTLAFFCILLHELGHSVVAIKFGVRVHSITLLPIGGVASMGHIPERPLHEFLISIAGPLVNVIIAAALLFTRGFPDFNSAALLPASLGDCLDFLTTANLALVVFNLIPAFPMDGGRMLRSGLAAFMTYGRATAVAASLGQVIALLFVTVGWHWNPLLPLIGLFVFWGAGSEARSVRVRIALQGKRVADVMRQPASVTEPDATLDQCAQALALDGSTDFVVVDGEGRPVGILPCSAWANLRGDPSKTRVGDVMLRRFATVQQEAEAVKLYMDVRLFRQDVFPVVHEGRVTGIVRIEDILRATGEWQEGRPGRAKTRRGWFMDFG